MELGTRVFGTLNSLACHRKLQPQYLTPINILAWLILAKHFFLGGGHMVNKLCFVQKQGLGI